MKKKTHSKHTHSKHTHSKHTHSKHTHSRKAKNPKPNFIQKEGAKNLPILKNTAEKGRSFSKSDPFELKTLSARQQGRIQCRPKTDRKLAIDAGLPALIWHTDLISLRVQCSMTTLAKECGLYTESEAGNGSISRFMGMVRYLEKLDYLTCKSVRDPTLNGYRVVDVFLSPKLFAALGVSEAKLEGAQRSRLAWNNMQLEKKGLPRLTMAEMVENNLCLVRDIYRSTIAKFKELGWKHSRSRSDAGLTRAQIEAIVTKQMLSQIAAGKISFCNLDDFRLEKSRRVNERMLMSSNNNNTQLRPGFT